MNILFLTTHFNTGGITSYILTLSGALVKAGHKVWVASSGGDCMELLEAAGGRHVTVNIRTKSEVHPKLWLALPALAGLVRREHIQIIHAQTRVTQVMGAGLSRWTDVAMVATCHGFFRPRWFRRKFPCWGQGVIAISGPVAEHLSRDFGVAENQIHLITNGIDLERFQVTNDEKRRRMRQKFGLGDGLLFGMIARLSSVKGIDRAIKALPFVLKEFPSAKLVIAGQGPEEAALRGLVRDMALQPQVIFKDTLQQTAEFLCALDVFVMPSLMEGLGLSVIEAQACGVTVVASRVGGLVELIEDGQSGYLINVNDPAALADRVLEIFSHPDQAKMMAQKARANVEKYFSARLMLDKTLRVYEQYSRR